MCRPAVGGQGCFPRARNCHAGNVYYRPKADGDIEVSALRASRLRRSLERSGDSEVAFYNDDEGSPVRIADRDNRPSRSDHWA